MKEIQFIKPYSKYSKGFDLDFGWIYSIILGSNIGAGDAASSPSKIDRFAQNLAKIKILYPKIIRTPTAIIGP